MTEEGMIGDDAFQRFQRLVCNENEELDLHLLLGICNTKEDIRDSFESSYHSSPNEWASNVNRFGSICEQILRAGQQDSLVNFHVLQLFTWICNFEFAVDSQSSGIDATIPVFLRKLPEYLACNSQEAFNLVAEFVCSFFVLNFLAVNECEDFFFHSWLEDMSKGKCVEISCLKLPLLSNKLVIAATWWSMILQVFKETVKLIERFGSGEALLVLLNSLFALEAPIERQMQKHLLAVLEKHKFIRHVSGLAEEISHSAKEKLAVFCLQLIGAGQFGQTFISSNYSYLKKIFKRIENGSTLRNNAAFYLSIARREGFGVLAKHENLLTDIPLLLLNFQLARKVKPISLAKTIATINALLEAGKAENLPVLFDHATKYCALEFIPLEQSIKFQLVPRELPHIVFSAFWCLKFLVEIRFYAVEDEQVFCLLFSFALALLPYSQYHCCIHALFSLNPQLFLNVVFKRQEQPFSIFNVLLDDFSLSGDFAKEHEKQIMEVYRKPISLLESHVEDFTRILTASIQQNLKASIAFAQKLLSCKSAVLSQAIFQQTFFLLQAQLIALSTSKCKDTSELINLFVFVNHLFTYKEGIRFLVFLLVDNSLELFLQTAFQSNLQCPNCTALALETSKTFAAVYSTLSSDKFWELSQGMEFLCLEEFDENASMNLLFSFIFDSQPVEKESSCKQLLIKRIVEFLELLSRSPRHFSLLINDAALTEWSFEWLDRCWNLSRSDSQFGLLFLKVVNQILNVLYQDPLKLFKHYDMIDLFKWWNALGYTKKLGLLRQELNAILTAKSACSNERMKIIKDSIQLIQFIERYLGVLQNMKRLKSPERVDVTLLKVHFPQRKRRMPTVQRK